MVFFTGEVGKKLDAADSYWRMEASFLEVLRQHRDHVGTAVCNVLEKSQALTINVKRTRFASG